MKRRIEDIITQAKADVASCGGYGEIGGRMRPKGYRIFYDGGSVYDFYKDGVVFHAHTNDYPKAGWQLEDYFNVYFPDDSLSTNFSINGEHSYPLEHFEVIFRHKLTSLGRFKTELERIKEGTLKYDRYLVCQYSNKYLKTLKSFDSFKEAKKYAFETAIKLAEDTPHNLRRYARLNPVDYGEDQDYLAMFIYYQYENCKHIVFIQGESN